MAVGGVVAAGSAWELFFRTPEQRAEDALELIDRWNTFRLALIGKNYDEEEALAFLTEDLAPQVAREKGRLHARQELPKALSFDHPPKTLEGSDPWLRQFLPELLADPLSARWIAQTPDLLKHGREAVERAAKGELPKLPFWQPEGKFSIVEEGGHIWLDPESHHRYDRLTRLLLEVDLDRAFQLYQALKPLLVATYGKDFEAELLKAIDIVLQTPEVHGKIELIPVKENLYRFADPKLEALLPVQKLLIRMGVENSRIIKVQLARFRAKILAAQREVNIE